MLNRLPLLILLGWLGHMLPCMAQTPDAASRYAEHSVLATGHWVKIRVPETGLYQLTDSLVRQAGFADAAHVSVWGYGGALQPTMLSDSYLRETDDLKPVPTYYADGRRLFHAVGPVNWATKSSLVRERNFYSSYGYYFLTEAVDDTSAEPLDSAAFADTFYPSPTMYNSLYEVEDYAWYHGGRNLFDKQLFGTDVSRSYMLPASADSGTLTVSLTFKRKFDAEIYLNDSLIASVTPGTDVVSSATGTLIDVYAVAGQTTWQQKIKGALKPLNTVVIKQLSGTSLRLDYLSINSSAPRPMWQLSKEVFPEPEIVGQVASQDRHADEWADMVIIIPASRKLQEQAQRLKQLHEEADSMRVNLVVADELYNEFSSGTPDGNAYRRYLKMLYDRAEDPSQRPRFLLLFGDGAWDNRMLLSDWSTTHPDDYLLCYESENSYNETKCYVSDDYFGLMDDADGGNMLRKDLIDVAVGRFPVTTPEDAKVMVDKVIAYYENAEAGSWQNLLCFMGDDGNKNMHMKDAEVVIAGLEQNYSGFQIQKIYWDAYKRSTTIAGDRYPDVERLIRQNMQDGALVMNYTGHGGSRSLSHEYVLSLTDFENSVTNHLPLWVTASCDIMPFDGSERTLGEVAVLAPHGGAISFYGTARTVYAFYNQYMNKCFMRHVLNTVNGRRNAIGEAARLAKNELITTGDDRTENKFQYVLLGDPALVLASPTLQAVIDSIDGQPLGGEELIKLSAGSRVTVSGRIQDADNFNGRLAVTVYDGEQTIVCRQNNRSESDTIPFTFKDYTNVIYASNHRVTDGRFRFTFTVSRDISYSDEPAKLLVYAMTDDHRLSAHGETRGFYLGSGDVEMDEQGPLLACYLNDPGFQDGGSVEQPLLFVAEIYDEDGVNASGSGIGHDLELVIDNKIAYTYNLNSYFEIVNDDYRQGVVRYQLPSLDYGSHKLRFRAWDMVGNSSMQTLNFLIPDPQGISAVNVGSTVSNAVFDTTGRRLSGAGQARGGLYIYRSQDGSVKKMMKRKQ